MNETTALLTNDDLSCKAIIDLVDNSDCDFYYIPQEQTGYVNFNTAQECYDFIDNVCNIKSNIIYLYDCFNCNEM